MHKKNTIYVMLIFIWLLLIATFSKDFLQPLLHTYKTSTTTFVAVLLSTLFILYFWLNGLKDIIYTLYFYLFHPKLPRPDQPLQDKPLVDVLYCTCDDFHQGHFLKCINQDYPNCRYIILDDSKDANTQRQIDTFANDHNITVIRRNNRIGFKAGNLNNYLRTSTASFFVILDSDEIIPDTFVSSALPYFSDPRIAIVQANHTAPHSHNKFIALFAQGVESHWRTYQTIKNTYGFLSFLGHGAIVRKSAYDEVHGFPELVAEDICFSIELRNMGYYVRFAPEIICHEDYPIDYLAFKRRHAKWTMGNMEFIKRYTWKVFTSHMQWFEKLDIVLFTYNLPLTILFVLYLAINVIIFPLLHFTPNYPLLMLIPTILFLLAPMLNDLIYFSLKKRGFSLLEYALCSLLLYGSMFYISLKCAAIALVSKATFTVTPKHYTKITWIKALLLNLEELGFAVVLSFTSLYFDHSLLPIILLAFPSLSSVYLTLLSNHEKVLV